jgi:hypothetical protein
MSVLTAGCVVLGCVLGILLGGAIAPPVMGEPWFKTYQSSVTALFSVISGGIALWFALRQLRINLMIREEDRMERMLPGLREARQYLHAVLVNGRNVTLLRSQLSGQGVTTDNRASVNRALDEQLPEQTT